MALSWNEIKSRAITFSKEWEDESRENAESQSFWNDFFTTYSRNNFNIKGGGNDTEKFERAVDEIIQAKKRGENTDQLEIQIGNMIYELYGLNKEEIAIVEGNNISN